MVSVTGQRFQLQSSSREPSKTAYRIWIIIRKRLDLLEKSPGTTNMCLCVYVCVANYLGYKYTSPIRHRVHGWLRPRSNWSQMRLQISGLATSAVPQPGRERKAAREDTRGKERSWVTAREVNMEKKRARAGINKTSFQSFLPCFLPPVLQILQMCRCGKEPVAGNWGISCNLVQMSIWTRLNNSIL